MFYVTPKVFFFLIGVVVVVCVECDGEVEWAFQLRVRIRFGGDHSPRRRRIGKSNWTVEWGTTVEVEWNNGRLREVALVLDAGLLDISLSKTETKFQSTNEKNDLPDSTSRDGIKSSKTSLHLSERKARGNVTTKSPTCGSNNVTNDGKHGNSTVLGLYVSQSFESFLISIVKKSKRIPES